MANLGHLLSAWWCVDAASRSGHPRPSTPKCATSIFQVPAEWAFLTLSAHSYARARHRQALKRSDLQTIIRSAKVPRALRTSSPPWNNSANLKRAQCFSSDLVALRGRLDQDSGGFHTPHPQVPIPRLDRAKPRAFCHLKKHVCASPGETRAHLCPAPSALKHVGSTGATSTRRSGGARWSSSTACRPSAASRCPPGGLVRLLFQ